MGTEFCFILYTDNGTEVELTLPGKFEVCDRCEGHGTHLNPSIGEHAYTPEEFAESFDDEERGEYFRRGGMYDVQCEECHGQRVVLVVDEKACRTQALKNRLRKYHKQEHSRAIDRREAEAERRMGY